ncbi:hypothetical protein IIB97_00540 [Patescibacteria group bacterium]|nr:hypothetical protein [Patescibacteria group bacterium]
MSTHTCKGVVLHCIDFRFRKRLEEFFHERFVNEDYDLIVVAGGAKSLVAESENPAFLTGQFDTSLRLHAPSIIVLVQHEDCGAYGGSVAFADFKAEFNFQKEELRKAAAFLYERFPKVVIERYFIRLSGEVLQIGEEKSEKTEVLR